MSKKVVPSFSPDILSVAFERPSPAELGFQTTPENHALYERQIENEFRSREVRYSQVMSEFNDSERGMNEASTQYGTMLIGKNIDKLAAVYQAFDEEKRRGKPHVVKQVFEVFPFYDVIASIVLTLTVDSVSSVRPLNSLSLTIARRIEEEINFLKLRETSRSLSTVAANNMKRKSDMKHKRESLRYWSERHAGLDWFKWTDAERMSIGHALITLMNLHLKWFKVETRMMREGGKTIRRNFLIAQAELIYWIEQCRKDLALMLRPTYEPMLVKPRQWSPDTVANGAFLTTANRPLPMIKTYNKTYLRELRNADMEGVYEALNNIQETAIEINKFTLGWMNYFVDNQVKWAEDVKLPVLHKRDVDDYVRRPNDADTNEDALFWYKKDCTEFHADEAKQRGKRSSFYMMLSLANKYQFEKQFFVPWQGDKRMRVYPVAKLNFQGADFTKAMLQFAEGVELGEHGLKWLMIHAANLYGVDKVSFEKRIEWVQEHKAHLIELAINPLGSRDFWKKADKPWQALAVANELNQAWMMEDPSKFISHLPVALDGSCSGLQILGSALRCEDTGQHVNLIPSDKPADIYGVVAGIVEKELRDLVGDLSHAEVLKLAERKAYEHWQEKATKPEDADWSYVFSRLKEVTSETDSVLIKKLRHTYFRYTEAWAWLQFGLNRSTVKRNVMTYCYGSEQFGFTEQCLEDILKPAYQKHRKLIAAGKESTWYFHGQGNRAAQLLAAHVFPAVKRTVLRAAQAMDWLQHTAKLIAKENRPVRWTTPLGFPVLQEYRKTKEREVNCKVLGIRNKLTVREEQLAYDANKAATAIAPNVVHSLDSAHLQAVVNLARKKLGIKSFALIHDSFGTHAGNTEGFFYVIREALVQLFTDRDVFAELYEEFKAQIKPELRDKIKDLPKYGNLNLEEVMDSLFAFA